jgi:glycosyltransferase involved in cell wall biosynthesis
MSELGAIQDRAVDIVILPWAKMSTAPMVVEAFGELGFDAAAVAQDDFVASPDRIAFLGGNARWHEPVLDRIRVVPRSERPLVAVWHTEPLPLPQASGLRTARLTARELAKIILRDRRINDARSNARLMHRVDEEGIVDLVTVSEKSFQAFLADEGIATEHIPLGYQKGHGHLLNLERDIDVLFLGDPHVRRRKRILQRLEREGMRVQAVGDYSDPRYWGDARTQLLNRTKILLNLSRHPGLQNDVRLMIGMATGALVVSEPIYLPDPYVPGVHYVEAPLDELAETMQRYLDDQQVREEMTAAAHAFVTEELTMKNCFARLLELSAAKVSAKRDLSVR